MGYERVIHSSGTNFTTSHYVCTYIQHAHNVYVPGTNFNELFYGVFILHIIMQNKHTILACTYHIVYCIIQYSLKGQSE